MISVKPTRQQQTKSEPSHEDYVVKEDNKRKWVPLAFLLLLTACAAYLKSFLPTSLETPAEAKEERPDISGEPESPNEKDMLAAEVDEEPTGSIGEQDARSSDNVVRLVLPRDAIETHGAGHSAFASAFPQPHSVLVPTSPGPNPMQIGQDNRPAGNDPKGLGGGGGGGGGGSEGGGVGPDAPVVGQPRRPADPEIDGPPDGDDPTDPDTAGRNRAPRVSGPVYLADVFGCNALLISVLMLLAGASDADGDQLRVVGLTASSGTVTQDEAGHWVFSRDQGMLGEVTLQYTISDGTHSIQQTAHFRVIEAPPIIGTAGDDNLLGTHCSDTIDGRAGDDNIDARGGNDTITVKQAMITSLPVRAMTSSMPGPATTSSLPASAMTSCSVGQETTACSAKKGMTCSSARRATTIWTADPERTRCSEGPARTVLLGVRAMIL